ncbi:unnamed protein product [Candidula unifasciata]|uniref:L-Fucosyltransferase n=1 Tax=Candidula unifasciata TaxID=100452 RepID=A0A8S3ZEG1_9EUPU|nr:unnamed protein product [Candidula unifasciata]
MNLSLQNLRVDGYLQSFCYFAEIMDEVRQEFTFQDHITVAALNLLNDVHINHNASVIVGVHARRGDILEKRWHDLGLRVPEKSYFVKAFRLLKSKCPGRNITFIVVSDDMTWCRENLFRQGVVCMPPASAAVHLAVLSMCDHVIINGGTYGWWAGWLAKGYVIYYTAYMANGTYFGRLVNRRTYYPPQWIGLEN